MGGKPLNGSGEEWVGGLGRFAWERKQEGRIKKGGDFANRSSLNLTKCQKSKRYKENMSKRTKKNQKKHCVVRTIYWSIITWVLGVRKMVRMMMIVSEDRRSREVAVETKILLHFEYI